MDSSEPSYQNIFPKQASGFHYFVSRMDLKMFNICEDCHTDLFHPCFESLGFFRESVVPLLNNLHLLPFLLPWESKNAFETFDL